MATHGAQHRYAVRVTEETLLDAIDKMEKAVEHVQSQFSTVRTGRATPVLVEKLQVEYYGSNVPLQQLAGFQVPEARIHTRVVNPPAVADGFTVAVTSAMMAKAMGENAARRYFLTAERFNAREALRIGH